MVVGAKAVGGEEAEGAVWETEGATAGEVGAGTEVGGV